MASQTRKAYNLGRTVKAMCFRSTLLTAMALAICSYIPSALASPAPSSGAQFQIQARKPDHLTEEAKISLLRYVGGEYAKCLQALPHEKKGFKVTVGKPLNTKELEYELRHDGVIANPGDTVQITKLEFHSKDVAVQINGGGKQKFHLREHLQVGIGYQTPDPPISDHPNEGHGTTIILEYPHGVPDLSPDELKHDLASLLDFSKHSAAVNWFDTLPPKIQQAIRDHQAVVGMDEEMVIAALGRADHKVREQNAQGEQTTTWIYGTPPAKTVFVIFAHEKVSRVEVFNDPGAPNSAGSQLSAKSN
ncbi:MAG TPA: hypothetical protein VFW94_15165 [Candidatus Acidoferrales bacterium]|nr:hypothetical protein [Candidatus Acidoferrales bacterium]